MWPKIQQLEYSTTSYFTIPYLPHVFYGVSLCLLGIFIPLNIALVGSDIVSTLRPDPTVEVNPWWMPNSWPKALRPRSLPQICQPVSINDDTPLRTNSSVPFFKYMLKHAGLAGAGTDPSDRIYPAPYMGNPLQSCEITTILMNMQLPLQTITYTFTILCSLGGRKDYSFKVPDNVTFTSTYHRAKNGDLGPDDMINFLSFNTFSSSTSNIFEASPALQALSSNGTSPTNVLGVLDALQADMFKAIWVRKNFYTSVGSVFNTTHVVEWAAGRMCASTTKVLDTPCQGVLDLTRFTRSYETTTGYAYDPDFMKPFTITIQNLLISLRDALMLDLGNIDLTSNIYLNKTYFGSSIQIDPYLADSLPATLNMTFGSDNHYITEIEYWQSCTWGWGCLNTTSWANALRSAPENTSVNNLILPWKPSEDMLHRPSVLSFTYLCPTLQRKTMGSLLMSVFVATATMLGVLYTIFEALMPKVERRYLRRKAAQGRLVNPNEDDRQEVIALVGRTRTPQSSQSPYDQNSLSDLPYKYDGYEHPYTEQSQYQPVSAGVGPYTYPTHNSNRR